MSGWIDAHNHLHDPRLGAAGPLVCAMQAAGIRHCVVNATREADWAAVETLATAWPDFITPAFGIHPWHAHTAAGGWQERLAALLEKHPQATIGECGLDRWIECPALEVQRPVFVAQLDLARQLDRPVTIHCLKAWGPLMEVLSQNPPPRMLLHSFGGSWETARELTRLGAWFSFSGHFLHPRKAAVLDVFRKLPRERILVETDAPDMLPPPAQITHPLPDPLNHPANLPAIACALSAALGIDPEVFAARARSNTHAWLGR
jgi:TatD DNase family protein